MAATLGRMERDGIIERQPDPADKRSARFSLAAPTPARAPQIAAAIRDMNAEALTNQSAGDVEELRQSLSIIAAAIKTLLGEHIG